jgi:hypothetical protein
MKKTKLILAGRAVRLSMVLGTLGVVLAGCSHGNLMREVPTDPPPRLAMLGATDAKGQQYMTWERAEAFGRVPDDRKAAGDITCMKLQINLRAQGFHPRALNVQGQPFSGGAYYCQVSLPAVGVQQPPQVVLREGAMVWNKPGAFGPVADRDMSRAQAACKQQNPKFTPLGYHPKPLDINGQPMTGGAFLCVE